MFQQGEMRDGSLSSPSHPNAEPDEDERSWKVHLVHHVTRGSVEEGREGKK